MQPVLASGIQSAAAYARGCNLCTRLQPGCTRLQPGVLWLQGGARLQRAARREAARRQRVAVQLDWLLALRSRSGDASSRDGYDATHKALWRAKTTENSKSYAKSWARVSPGVFVSPGVLENTWSSSLGIARRRSARPPQAAPSPRTTLFLIRAASAALKYWATMLVD